jgi:hypothetical protein
MSPLVALAQVDEIKEASARSSRSASDNSDGKSSGGGILSDVFLFLPHWQSYKLHPDNRQRYPSMVSLETMIPGGYKTNDFFFWPRIRGNWGLFSTDFRMNYIFEKDDAGGYKQLHTNDWQILQLNITTSRILLFRVGAGLMTEAFGNFNQYTELTLGFGIHAPDQSSMFYAEYRDAYKAGVDMKARIEFNAQYMHQIFRTGALKGYVTGGVVYQKYYSQIDFWAVQAGLAFRVFKDAERF